MPNIVKLTVSGVFPQQVDDDPSKAVSSIVDIDSVDFKSRLSYLSRVRVEVKDRKILTIRAKCVVGVIASPGHQSINLLTILAEACDPVSGIVLAETAIDGQQLAVSPDAAATSLALAFGGQLPEMSYADYINPKKSGDSNKDYSKEPNSPLGRMMPDGTKYWVSSGDVGSKWTASDGTVFHIQRVGVGLFSMVYWVRL